MGHEYPKQMYSRTKDPVTVNSVDDEKKLNPQGKPQEWFPRYIHREYPKALHRPDGTTVTVNDKLGEDSLLAEGADKYSLRPFPKPEPEPERASTSAGESFAMGPSAFQKVQEVEFTVDVLRQKLEASEDANAALKSRIDALETDTHGKMLTLAGRIEGVSKTQDELRSIVVSLKTLLSDKSEAPAPKQQRE